MSLTKYVDLHKYSNKYDFKNKEITCHADPTGKFQKTDDILIKWEKRYSY